ncbi:MAG: trypsin-like serine protease [Pseudomonadota bacterium]
MALVLCLALLGSALWAQDVPMLSAEDHGDWQAIGRLNVAGYNKRRTCTAALIAPDTVLTAAHCVVFPDGRPIPERLLRFVPGWFRGDYAALGLVTKVTGADAFAEGLSRGQTPIPRDTAVLTLTDPIEGIPPLTTSDVKTSLPVRILGYRHDRPHALSDSGPCPFQMTQDVLVMQCPATFGNSGGPVLQRQGSDWTVVGVVSAIDGKGTTFAPVVP